MESISYTLFPSNFGSLSIVWKETENDPKILRIFLSNETYSSEKLVKRNFVNAHSGSCQLIENIRKKIQNFLIGELIKFKLNNIALEVCSTFQKRVLLAEYKIPRGWVSTYGRIARLLGIPAGARAVGRALSTNPFPIIIPCHRAIKSNRELGGFQGGLKMKRALLEFEGIKFTQTNIVVMDNIYY